MKIFLVIDETSFYHPSFLFKFLKATVDQVVGAGLVTKIPSKSSIELYMMRHWYYLNIDELVLLAYRKYKAKILDLLGRSLDDTKGFYPSVRAVLDHFNVDYFEVETDINQECYLGKIKSKEPDVIISSNSLIFGKELLNIPSICSINRHSSLLPSYGGIWPVLQAYRCGENIAGVSVHLMQKKIDQGPVLSYREVEIEKNCTLSFLYERCFDLSSDVLLESLDRIRNGDFQDRSKGRVASYYSFPTKEHWKQFRQRGGRLV